MKMLSIFKNKEARPPWQKWPSCNFPKTLSFRVGGGDHNNMFKTVNSVFVDGIETPEESCFTNSSKTASFNSSTDSDDGESLEVVVREVKRSSERLFFEPGDNTSSSILSASSAGGDLSDDFKESNAMLLRLESENPFVDFRKSMEEMVSSQDGLKRDWEGLEKLLSWYLRVNRKNHHDLIISAFVDMLVDIAAPATNSSSFCDSTTTYYSTAVSSFTSTSLSSSSCNEIDHQHDMVLS